LLVLKRGRSRLGKALASGMLVLAGSMAAVAMWNTWHGESSI
jgi:predicted RecA/RadA family phage recombinase